MFGEAGRIDMDFVQVGNEEKVSVLRQCSLVVVISRDLVVLSDKYGIAQPTKLLRNMATEGASTSSLLLHISSTYTEVANLAGRQHKYSSSTILAGGEVKRVP